jgi:hypothetical protein
LTAIDLEIALRGIGEAKSGREQFRSNRRREIAVATTAVSRVLSTVAQELRMGPKTRQIFGP